MWVPKALKVSKFVEFFGPEDIHALNQILDSSKIMIESD